MRRYKYRKSSWLFIALWGMIFILSILLLFKSMQTYGTDSFYKASQTLESNMVSAACNTMMQSKFPILNYIDDRENSKNNNMILNTLAGVFPINRYVADAGNVVDDNRVETYNNSLLFSNGFNLLFNENTYNQSLNYDDADNTYSDSGNLNPDEESSSLYLENDSTENMPIDIIDGDVYMESEDAGGNSEDPDIEAKETLGTINGEHFTIKQLLDRQFLYNNFYIIDSSTVVSDDLFDAEVLLGKDMTMKAKADKPQILIYHTHSQETFVDSKKGEEEDTIVGVGNYLTELLTDKYGYNVIHDKSQYDMAEGYLERDLAYDYAGDGIEKILEENPTIEVVIDLHRDGVSDDLPKGSGKRVAKINGKYVAQLMPFNGLSRNSKGAISRLKNPYIQDNLAFSLQFQLKGREMYPGLMYKNYLKAYRYNAHLCKKSILIETGTNRNTVEEAMNAMDYLADIMNEVLTKEEE